jgi:hypothetical protein
MVIVSDAMSIGEAARLYCEDKGLVSRRNDGGR